MSTIVSVAGAVRELGVRTSFIYSTDAQTIYTFTVGGVAVWMPTYFIRVRGLSVEDHPVALDADRSEHRPDREPLALEHRPLLDVQLEVRADVLEPGARLVRTVELDPVLGTLLGGLFFIAYMRDPGQFVTLQQKLGTSDALNEYIQHTGSGLFACPPGISSGQHWGDRLFAET